MAAIGTILQRSSFTDLSDFDVKGNWEVNSDALLTTGANSVLQYKYASALDQFQIKVKTDSPSLVMQMFGIKSANNIRTAFSVSNGRAKWDFAYNNTNGTSDTSIVIDNGDILEYIFTKTQWTVSFELKNISKNTSSFVLVPAASSSITAHKVRFYSASQAKILFFEKWSDQEFQPLNLLVGDSITYGSSATIPANRWGTKAGFQIEGSAGDTSSEGLELLHEITNIIRPKRVIYAFGTNDLNIEDWKNNLMEFKAKIEQKNIVFIPIAPYANNNRSMQPYFDYINSNFNEYFDLFGVTKQAGNTNLKAEFNVDGTHFNNAGHQACADFVLNSPYYSFIPVDHQTSSALRLLVLSKWFN